MPRSGCAIAEYTPGPLGHPSGDCVSRSRRRPARLIVGCPNPLNTHFQSCSGAVRRPIGVGEPSALLSARRQRACPEHSHRATGVPIPLTWGDAREEWRAGPVFPLVLRRGGGAPSRRDADKGMGPAFRQRGFPASIAALLGSTCHMAGEGRAPVSAATPFLAGDRPSAA